MRSILKGPLPFIAFAFVLLAVASGMLRPGASLAVYAEDAGPFHLAGALHRVVDSRSLDGLPYLTIISQALLAITGGVFFSLFQRWTGNRIVSIVAALLFVLHPVHAQHWKDSFQVLTFLPMPLVLLALSVHLQISRHRFFLRAFWTLLFGLAALYAGPLGLVTPLLMAVLLLTDFQSPVDERRSRAFECILHLLLVILVASSQGRIGTLVPHLGDTSVSVAELLFVSKDTPLFPHLGWVILSGLLLVLALSLAIASRRRMFLFQFAGLASGWVLALELSAILGWLPREHDALGLALAPLCLLAPMMVWRVLLECFPPDAQSYSPVPIPRHFPLWDKSTIEQPGWPSKAAATSLPIAELLSLRQLVAGMREMAHPQAHAHRSSAMANEAYDRAYMLGNPSVLSRNQSSKGIADPWSDTISAQQLFDDHCRPHLKHRGTVIEIGPSDVWLTHEFLKEQQQVITVGAHISDLSFQQVLQSEGEPIVGLLSRNSGLRVLASGIADFAIASRSLLYADQATLLSCILELKRVLRPGGRALLVLGNLLDPAGMKHLRSLGESAVHSEADLGYRQYTTPEVVRALAENAGITVDSIQLAANNIDMIVNLEHQVLGPSAH
jgi:hypothetical protein